MSSDFDRERRRGKINKSRKLVGKDNIPNPYSTDGIRKRNIKGGKNLKIDKLPIDLDDPDAWEEILGN